MMKNWELKMLGEVCDFEGGSQPPKTLFSKVKNENFIRLIQIRDYKSDDHIVYIPQNKAKRFCDEKDIMIGRYGPPVFQILKGLKGAYNVALMKATPREDKISRNYLFLFLKYSKIQAYIIHLSQRAAGQTGVSKTALETYPILIPPIHEQQRIVAILDEVLATIAKAKENAEKNLKNARELFESYLQSVFANPGDGWEVKKLGEVCDFYNGQAHEPYIDESGEYKVINSKFISSEGKKYKKTNKVLFPLFRGDITMVMSDVPKGKTLAKCFLIDEDDTYTLNQRICVIRSANFKNKFLYYQLNRNKYFLSFDNGENQTNLRKNDILNCPILIPTFTEQKAIIKKLDALFVETKKLEDIYKKKLTTLDELKESVLQKAFNGELTGGQ